MSRSVDRARYTVAIPPLSSSSRISYRPTRLFELMTRDPGTRAAAAGSLWPSRFWVVDEGDLTGQADHRPGCNRRLLARWDPDGLLTGRRDEGAVERVEVGHEHVPAFQS